MTSENNESKLSLEREIVVGVIVSLSGSRATCKMNSAVMARLQENGEEALRMTGAIGSQLKARVNGVWLIADIREVKRYFDEKGEWVIAEIEFLGEGDISPDGGLRNFRRGISYYPRPGTNVCAVTSSDLVQAFDPADRAHIEIGTIYPTLNASASILIDALLGKHFSILGSTGTGKSTLLALMLHKLIEIAPQGHVVVIDPHGEYAAPFADKGVVFNIDTLRLPFWILNFEEHCEVLINTEGAERELDKDVLRNCLLIARGRNKLAATIRNLNVDTPVPYAINDLLNIMNDQMGKLENRAEASRYIRLRSKLEELTDDPRFAFMFDRGLYFDKFADVIANLLRMPANNRPVSILDLSRIPSDLINVVVAVLARVILDYAIWSRGEETRPVLLICEEAQRYLPSERLNVSSASRRILERIAKEGRKYGISLGLVSQRPSDVSEAALSQCGTMLSMRLNNERDQAVLRSTMPEVGRAYVSSIQALRNRECIICGEGVPIPMRVRIMDLPDSLKPASENPVFSELWRRSGGESETIDRTINRWINQEL
ncbi:ATP-binding protein [Methylocystis echinoides]|nr:DUF87 domain-containing protein [Methylocystis echinoides]